MNSIHGTTERCLAHLAKAVAGRDFLEKRRTIAKFVGVGDSTVYRWFKAVIKPVGEPLVRLRFYLEFLGYEVTELEDLKQPVRDAGRVYAFGVADLDDLMKEVGIPNNENGRTQMLSVLRGVQGFSDERMMKISAFAENFKDLLYDRLRATPRVLSVQDVGMHPSKGAAPIGTSTTNRLPHGVGNQSAVIESFAGLITAMLPLAEYVLSDSFTAAQRSRVRELAGGGKGVSRLSNLFTQLSGEAARSALTKQQ